ncbi:MAG: hypothetical protein A3G95_03775 [Flavobacteria bacterium RIFCSPLOWO2_12_FULL_31_7]|nr:MAG: hypothetical protein A3G95_03775 [Flavobacteria bacterium RIFCSPLOWO2_12_FULL_31_7]
MNSEDKIYNKIKNASHKGEKDFPGMDKVWNRVEEKLDNTIVVQKKNTWQKLAIAATVLLSFSIIYQFVSKDENIKNKIIPNSSNPVIVSNDSAIKIIDEANEIVVENETSNQPNANKNRTKDNLNLKNNLDNEMTNIERDSIIYETLPNGKIMARTYDYPNKIVTSLEDDSYLRSNFTDNSASNSSSTNSGFIAPNKKYNAPIKEIKSKYKAPKSKPMAAPAQQSKDLVVIDGVAMDKNYNAEKELNEISSDNLEEVTYLPNPLYIINGIEYSEESLFGKNPTSPYAPLDKQKITSTNILKPADATKIYGKKGEKGIVIITTKDGKPAEK